MSAIVNDRTLNRIKRVTDLIDDNAKLATSGEWRISHGHVYTSRPKLKPKSEYDVDCFDICSQPSERQHTVYGVHPGGYGTAYADMKHIATCKPTTMTKLVADVRELLTEREDPRALVTNLINVLGIGSSRHEEKLLAALEEYRYEAIR